MTTSWYRADLGDALLADAAMEQIRRLLTAEVEAAVFCRHESGDLHCSLILYFSPAAAAVARSVGAAPCNKPAPQGLSLLSTVSGV